MKEIDYEYVTNEYDSYAESVGKGVRAIALGTIGAIWAVMSAEGVILEDTALCIFSTPHLVKFAFIFASSALLFDLLQGVTAFWMYHIGLEKWEKKREKNQESQFTFAYDDAHLGKFGVFLYWSNTACMPIKLVLAIFAGVTFVCLTFTISLAPV